MSSVVATRLQGTVPGRGRVRQRRDDTEVKSRTQTVPGKSFIGTSEHHSRFVTPRNLWTFRRVWARSSWVPRVGVQWSFYSTSVVSVLLGSLLHRDRLRYHSPSRLLPTTLKSLTVVLNPSSTCFTLVPSHLVQHFFYHHRRSRTIGDDPWESR